MSPQKNKHRINGTLHRGAEVSYRHQREDYQVYTTDLKYVWVQEAGQSTKFHYHVAVFVNKDTFNALGDYSKWDNNLESYISEAWLSVSVQFE